MQHRYTLRTIIVFLLALSAFIAYAAGTANFSFDGTNVVTVSGDADGEITINWGDGASWTSGDPAGTYSESHGFTYTATPGGYDVTVTVSGAVSASETFTICWVDCNPQNNGNGNSNDDSVPPASPITNCSLNNPSDIVPVATDDEFWQVEGSNVLFGETGKVSYVFNTHNHQDQIYNGHSSTSRRILNQDGDHVGDLWVVDHRYPDPYWRCGAVFFGIDGSWGRPQLNPEDIAETAANLQALYPEAYNQVECDFGDLQNFGGSLGKVITQR